VMFILARGGQTIARLRYNSGPGAELSLPVEVDFSRPFSGSSIDAWQAEYEANVRKPPVKIADRPQPFEEASQNHSESFLDDWRREAWEDFVNFEQTRFEEEFEHTPDN